MKNIHLKYNILVVAILFITVGCQDDFLDTEPAENVSTKQLAKNPASTQSTLNGVYASLRTYGVGGNTGHVDYGHMAVKNATDMMAHDVTISFLHWFGFYHNYDGRVQTSSRTRIIWNTYYSQILATNTVANVIPLDTDDQEGKWLLGQALALRGLFYFNLVRLYADTYIGHENDPGVPLYDGSSFEGQPRSSVKDVYGRIVDDLSNAVTLLEGFERSSKQEVDQSVAYGFLARAYLEMGEWQKAAEAANNARDGYVLTSYLDGFADISDSEWMWGSDIDSESSTIFASFFSHFDNTNDGYAGALGVYKAIDANLYSQIPDTDVRKNAFVDPVNGNVDYPKLPDYANIKFRDPTFFEGDYVYMRAAEMYLIEAEALARSNNANAANVLFDLVSERDPGYTKSTNSGNSLVEEIYLQRRIELWGEGFSWFDLKRLGKDMVRDYPGSNHADFAKFNIPAGDPRFKFQIPEDEINANDAISAADQNL